MFVITRGERILSVWPVVEACETYVTVAVVDWERPSQRRATISFWEHEGYLVCPD